MSNKSIDFLKYCAMHGVDATSALGEDWWSVFQYAYTLGIKDASKLGVMPQIRYKVLSGDGKWYGVPKDIYDAWGGHKKEEFLGTLWQYNDLRPQL